MKRRVFLSTTGMTLALALAASTAAWAENAKLKIGFVGVTSGPAAAWGISNQRSMEARAAWLNELGGVKIGDATYDIEIVPFDDQKDPKRAIAGMEKMAQDGIHYVVGPNVDDGAAAVRPVAEQNGIIYFPYAFPKELYTAPASNARSSRSRSCAAVTNTTGTSNGWRRSRSPARTSNPSMPGIIMSSSTRSGGEASKRSSASSPLPAVATSYDCRASSMLTTRRLAGWSSTTRMRPVEVAVPIHPQVVSCGAWPGLCLRGRGHVIRTPPYVAAWPFRFADARIPTALPSRRPVWPTASPRRILGRPPEGSVMIAVALPRVSCRRTWAAAWA